MNGMENQDSWVLFPTLAGSELLRQCSSLKILDSHFLPNFMYDFK